jgi:hypothetical protein
MQDSILTVLATVIVVASISVFVHRYLAGGFQKQLGLQLEKANHAERQTHLRELEHLEERKKREIVYARELEQARISGFDEGKRRGTEESEAALSLRLAKQQEAFSIQLQAEKIQAAKEARDLERAEYELQAKLFSVKISPYVQLVTNKGFVYDDFESRVGYQYQLLINGIPAFQPHVVVERHEKNKEFDPAVKQALISVAQGCAEAALATYLGANPQFAKIAPVVVETVTS